VKVCPLLTARRANAYGITDKGHIMGKGTDQDLRGIGTGQRQQGHGHQGRADRTDALKKPHDPTIQLAWSIAKTIRINLSNAPILSRFSTRLKRAL
jgi:hypothetical protein